MELNQLELVAGVLTAIASLGAFVRWVWPLIKKLGNKMLGNEKIHKRLDELSTKLNFIVSEMTVNGGASIKDQLNRVEEVCSLTNERQRARMLDSDDLVFESDENGDVIWVNRTYARTVQRVTQELLGHGWVNAIAPDYRERVTESWYNSVAEDREFEMSFEFATPDGDTFPVILRSYKMRDPRKATIGFLGTITLL